MMTSAPNAKVLDLAHRLVGSIGDGGLQDELNELTTEECISLDIIAFCCTSCDWWFNGNERTEDADGQRVCLECKRETKS